MDVKGLSHARWVTHIALAAATRRAWIANAYFVPPPVARSIQITGREPADEAESTPSGENARTLEALEPADQRAARTP